MSKRVMVQDSLGTVTYSNYSWERVSPTMIVCENNEDYSVKYEVRQDGEDVPYLARYGPFLENRWAYRCETLNDAMAVVEDHYKESSIAKAPRNTMDSKFGSFDG